MDKVKLAKISIFIMTTLIFLGLIALGLGVRTKLKQAIKKDIEHTITLKTGSKINSMSEYDDYLALHTTASDGDAIIIIDPRNGEFKYKINIHYSGN